MHKQSILRQKLTGLPSLIHICRLASGEVGDTQSGGWKRFCQQGEHLMHDAHRDSCADARGMLKKYACNSNCPLLALTALQFHPVNEVLPCVA